MGELKDFHYEITIRGHVRSPSHQIAEAFVKGHMHLSLVLHDSMDDLRIVVQQDPFDKLKELK